MEPLQALAELDNAVGTINANRQVHAHLMKCVFTVRAALNKQATQEKPEEKNDVTA
jgi:hypothetical protein